MRGPATPRALVAAVTAVLLVVSGATACSSTDDDLEEQSTQGMGDLADENYPAEKPDAVPAPVNERADTFVTMINEPGGVFLPGFQDNGWDVNATAPIFAGLVSRTQDGTVIPDLAESWDISDDNLTYTYHLRDGLTFSDGSPLTADDVKFTLTLFNDPAFSGRVDFSDIGIVGADAYKNGDAGDISGITVEGPDEVQIRTEHPSPLALTVLGGPVLSRQYYGADYRKGKIDYLKDLYGKPLGSGPYVLDRNVPGQEIRYLANGRYYGGKPQVKHLIFRVVTQDGTLPALQNGDIDHGFFDTQPQTLDAVRDLGFLSGSTRVNSDFGQIRLNSENPKLSDTRVRQALTYGLDREQVSQARNKGQGQVADIYAPPPLWSFDDEGVSRYGFDPGKAKELLDAAGWVEGDGGIREKDGQKFTLRYITTDEDDAVIPLAKQNYRDIGIDFIPEVLDNNTATSRLLDHDYEALGQYTQGIHDPDDAVKEFGTDDPRINVTGYHNDKVSDLVTKGHDTTDRADRQRIYSELYKELSQDPPTILVDYRRSINAWNNHIGGVENFQTGAEDAALNLASLTTGAGKS
jgi:peptide/nickel transport system substrate-binding protein